MAAFTIQQWKLIQELAALEANPPPRWAGEQVDGVYRTALQIERDKLRQRATQEQRDGLR